MSVFKLSTRLCLLFCIVNTFACGQKGALYLPPVEKKQTPEIKDKTVEKTNTLQQSKGIQKKRN